MSVTSHELGVDHGGQIEEGEIGDPGVVFEDGAVIVELPERNL